MHYVIIGAGPAGVVAAETLRNEAPTDEITLVGAEDAPPYSRMAIPYMLSGRINEGGTYLRKDNHHYRDLGIATRCARVERVDTHAKTLLLDDGESLTYDRLLIATGSHPVMPELPGSDLPGVKNCWTLEDARAIVARAQPGSRVVLIGAGFVACVIIKALLDRGVDLTIMLGGSGRMVRSMMDEDAGRLIRRWCEQEKGIRIVSGARTERFENDVEVVLESGERLQADLVIVASGVRTNTGFLAGSGIDVDVGIKVDEHMQTSVPDVYAAGDVAQGRNLSTGEWDVHAIQPTAVEHGRIAALNMLGKRASHRGSLAMNVLDAADLITCSYGLWQGKEGGTTARFIDDENYRYLRLEFFDNRLVGVNCVGMTEFTGCARGLIQSGTPLGEWEAVLQREPVRLKEAYVACAGNRPATS
jgi:NAD(P)H-nitrite reductase large subunit